MFVALYKIKSLFHTEHHPCFIFY